MNSTTSDEETLPTRYIDFDGVEIDEACVPTSFRHLTDDAIEWSIGDDVERGEYMASLSKAQIQSFVAAVSPHIQDISSWCKSGHLATPVPDEIIIFDHLLEAVAEGAVALARFR